MSDIKWIKLATNMHDDEKVKLIDAMPERDTIHYLWIRLLIQAGKTNANGLIYLSENIPYTDEMLATIFSRPLASIRLALKVLSDFQMIEIAEDNEIKIVNWDKHQNVEGMDRVRDQNRKRVQNHREKKKQLKASSEEASTEIEDNECNDTQNSCNVIEDESNVTVTEQNKRETKNKKEIKNENKKEKEDDNTCDEKKDLIFTKCFELQKYCETMTGIAGGLNWGALKVAVSIHGEKYVRMAIDIGLKANKPNMTYIDGILKNWVREGYPTDKEVKKNVNRSYGKNSNPDKNEFAGFKPKKSRSLTADERKKAEETLI